MTLLTHARYFPPQNPHDGQQREGEISIVEVLCEVHPRASDGDLAKMLEWISEPTRQGPGKAANRELAMAERLEIASLFQM